MGNKISEIVNDRYVNFEDVQQYIRKRDDHFILLNTLPSNMQSCLISSTVNAHEEESIINHLIHDNKNSWLPTSQSNSIDNVSIVIYGKNNNDQKVFHKHNQLQNLGFTNVYIYPGGMFEWLLLQDIYGDSEFPTSSNELDLLRYKPSSSFRQKLNPNQNLLMAP